MQSFFDWMEVSGEWRSPWLMLGKGPSFAKRLNYDLGKFNLLSLNHAVREQPVLVAHAIDLDVLQACEDVLSQNAGYLVAPWVPHVGNKAGRHTLEELLPRNSVLKDFGARERLLWYNLSTAGTWRHVLRHGSRKDYVREGSPIVDVRFFSATAALDLLVQAGVRTVRSLGIDGGASYSREFDDLRGSTLLANERSSFDAQFTQIARTIMSTGVDYAPLDLDAPVRVYVGSQEAQMLSVKVLEYSIRKHASLSVEVHPLHERGAGIEIPVPADVNNRPRTPFSFQRFLIPSLAGHEGRAIYVDSDMQVFKDIRELWTLPFQGNDLLAAREPGETGRKPQFSVMLLNCDTLHWEIAEIVAALDRGELTYETLMYDMAVAPRIDAAIDPAWNSLERHKEGETALVHYTDMNTQPWVSTQNPLGHLWVRDLLDAVQSGFISRAYVQEHVERGFVRPSILHQIDTGLEDPLLLTGHGRSLDKNFVPPYRKMANYRGGRLAAPAHLIRAALRHLYHRTGVARLHDKVKGAVAS